jgi:hypothetical protein
MLVLLVAATKIIAVKLLLQLQLLLLLSDELGDNCRVIGAALLPFYH